MSDILKDYRLRDPRLHTQMGNKNFLVVAKHQDPNEFVPFIALDMNIIDLLQTLLRLMRWANRSKLKQ